MSFQNLIYLKITLVEAFISIQMGNRFDYIGKSVYPIFMLKANGQIVCLIEIEE
jgi:hypothetical protein